MSKTCYRYFGGLLNVQEKWLNKMAAKGYRLVRSDKMLYEFEECAPNDVQYRMEFIGQKTKNSAEDYRDFLEGMGYKVFYKSINLNYSIGKVRYRPWAQKGARIATNSTTFNRELFIVEKDNDGKPFELHTSFEDRAKYYQNIRNAWLWVFIVVALSGALVRSIFWGIIALIALIPVVVYQIQIFKNRHNANIQEW